MSGVPKNKRGLSKKEFFHRAINLHANIERLVAKDLGVKSKIRDLRAFVYLSKMLSADREVFTELCNKYGITVEAAYPYILLEKYERRILEINDALIHCITEANTIYATTESEWNYRRKLQWDAISYCRELSIQFSLAVKVLPCNAEELMAYVAEVKREYDLLKLWKKSDNKILKAIQENDKQV